MFEEKNLKDTEGRPQASYGSGSQNMSFILSYSKINKLITALFMVTDIIDQGEPLRHKLRTLGTNILSDIYSHNSNASVKIKETLSFLDISLAVNLVSPMNHSILKREFLNLGQSLKQFYGKTEAMNESTNLVEFFGNELPESSVEISKGHFQTKGEVRPARLGVQKGSTLLRALSDTSLKMSFTKSDNFDIAKKQRQTEILNIIKLLGANSTIKDIKTQATARPNQFNLVASCGEKTLQRELASMVKSGVLDKVGNKRWSRYFLKVND